MERKPYPRFEFSNPLTPEHIDFFERHGFIHFKDFISTHAIKVFQNEIKVINQKLISSNAEKVNGVPLKFGYDLDGQKIVQRFAFSSLYSEVFHEFLLDPRFKALYPLLGPDAQNIRIGENEKDGLVINHYINSHSSGFSRMGWHTDSLRDIFYGKKIMPMLNVGVHLTDAFEGTGGLRILPGSHKQKLMSFLFKKPYFLDHRTDKNEIGIITKAGDLTIHDGRLWHRVAMSTIQGEKSRRQVMYIPLISGEHIIKHEKSPTLFYQRFYHLFK